ncbi:MAG TPA: thioredoxin [Flavobacteriaceae bacterium]|nr:thioredoxin [Flavobacteriaceae bacterium]|tara:strand:- start:1268 stop:1750 length:483 start_codon:yes stop_codon:yes gene_type:complete
MKNKKIMLIFFVVGMLVPLSGFSQIVRQSFEQLDDLQKSQKRFVVVFINTDWCSYCQVMKNTTFKDEKIVELLNQNFWFVDLNAEEKRNIIFNGYTFKFRPTGNSTGIHELAEQLATLDGEVTYPTLCVLNANYEIIFQYNQLLSANDLKLLLKKMLKSA